MIRDFICQFTNEELPYIKMGKKTFLSSESLLEVVKGVDDEVIGVGMVLGEEVKKQFSPSLALLDWMGARTSKVAVVDDKAAWLFTCGRDIFEVGIEKCSLYGLVIVKNKRGEVLGFGDRGKGIKNIRHIGEYLKESL